MSVREAALQKVTDEAALARIGRTNASMTGAEIIVQRIHDQALLADLALHGNSWVKDKARAALTDEGFLAEILKGENPFNYSLGRRDVCRIRSQALLADFAANGKTHELRVAGIKRLRDTVLLAKIAAGPNANWYIKDLVKNRLAALRSRVTITGTLTEKSLGQPLGRFPVELGSHLDPVADAETDAEGRFTFTGVESGKMTLTHYGLAVPRGADGADIEVTVPTTGRVDLGTIEVSDDESATRTFGTYCDEGGRREPVPHGDLLVLKKTTPSSSWNAQARLADQLKGTIPWPGVLCIAEYLSSAGSYVDDRGSKVGSATDVTWQVRLIRTGDGQVFVTRVTGAPPQQATIRDGRAGGTGNALTPLKEWLKGIR